MVYLPTFTIKNQHKSTKCIGKYTVRPMDSMGYKQSPQDPQIFHIHPTETTEKNFAPASRLWSLKHWSSSTNVLRRNGEVPRGRSCVNAMSLAILCDLFGMVKWPLQRLSDLQLGDKKVTLNHQVCFFQWKIAAYLCLFAIMMLLYMFLRETSLNKSGYTCHNWTCNIYLMYLFG